MKYKLRDDYHCECGWSRVVLDNETMEDARKSHESTEIHRLAMESITYHPGNFDGYQGPE